MAKTTRRNPLTLVERAASRMGITAEQIRKKLRQGWFGRVLKDTRGRWQLTKEIVDRGLAKRRGLRGR